MSDADALVVHEAVEAMLWRHGSGTLWVVGLSGAGMLTSTLLWGPMMLTMVPLWLIVLRLWGERRAYQLACRFVSRFPDGPSRDVAVALLLVKQSQVYGATLAARVLLGWIGREGVVDASASGYSPRQLLARAVDWLFMGRWLYRSAKLPVVRTAARPRRSESTATRAPNPSVPIPLEIARGPGDGIELGSRPPPSQQLDYIPLDPKKEDEE